MVNLLIERGALVNVADKLGDTPVHTAIAHPHDADGVPLQNEEIIELKLQMISSLIDAGATLEVSNNAGKRPLHVAIEFHLEIVAALLLLKRCELRKRQMATDGTPLHLCAISGEQT